MNIHYILYNKKMGGRGEGFPQRFSVEEKKIEKNLIRARTL
jgi:hypothetical protein